uniref:Uncharacterized protein n=1 Tax=Arundo donax TaxID=35708 RepID=A0A0A9D921_ARUDO
MMMLDGLITCLRACNCASMSARPKKCLLVSYLLLLEEGIGYTKISFDGCENFPTNLHLNFLITCDSLLDHFSIYTATP